MLQMLHVLRANWHELRAEWSKKQHILRERTKACDSGTMA
jgi:hypothetical protein